MAKSVKPARPARTAVIAHKNPDQALLALGPKIEAADKIYERTFDLLKPIEEALHAKRPPRPTEPKPLADDEDAKALRLAVNKWMARRDADPRAAKFKARLRQWEARCAQLEAKLGVREAERRRDLAADKTLALRDKVAATKATTLRGLIFKAKYAAEHFPDEYEPDVMASIVDDLLAMQRK